MNNEASGCGCLIILVIVIPFLFTCLEHVGMTFSMPTTKDYMQDCYRQKAFDEAHEMAAAQERKYWEGLGYSAERDLKYYEVYIIENKDESEKEALQNRTVYLGKGTYEVTAVVGTYLGETRNNKYEPKTKIYRAYKVRISSHPKRRFYGTVNLNWTQDSIVLMETQNKGTQLECWRKDPEKGDGK